MKEDSITTPNPNIVFNMVRSLFSVILMLLTSCLSKVESPLMISTGVSRELASYRKKQVSEVKYHLYFKVPESISDAIPAHLTIKLFIQDLSQPLLLDFKSNRENPNQAIINGKKTPLHYEKEHLIIAKEHLQIGHNAIEIAFTAGETSLNRNSDYLFTLLVPDRARTLFPCFDQPDIKATYTLNLQVPKDWKVLSSSSLEKSSLDRERMTFQFKETDLMSTYLFSFVAGKFAIENSSDSSFKMSLYHQEKDSHKIQLSVPEIFKLHQQAIDYLEAYTTCPFPFLKLDYATIFSHPYGGMEHTGAIQYRQSSLFLDETSTLNQKLWRAKLIAHETAHMWFGNLVSIEWFNDVWLKEVFANFIADKVINPQPQFQDIDHDLSFFVDHYPPAYSVDRSTGANPIRQALDNLNNAGSLYGSIIYHKAPIMMRQLETILGVEKFQRGVIEYIDTYRHDNASWPDLIHILDQQTTVDLKAWSDVWVNSSGRPIITSDIVYDGDNQITSFMITQQAEYGSDKVWPQVFEATLVYPDTLVPLRIDLHGKATRIAAAEGKSKPEAILYNSDGFGYGVFPINTQALELVNEVQQDLIRAVVYQNCHENVLLGNLPMDEVFETYLKGIEYEKNELVLSLLSDQTLHLFWSYLAANHRNHIQQRLTHILISRLASKESSTVKKTLYDMLVSIGYLESSRNILFQLWSKQRSFPNLMLNQDDNTKLARQLALFGHPKASDILKKARSAIKDPNKQKRFDFLLPALSQNPKTRDDLFRSFAYKANREKENWVLLACKYLHHPLRQHTSIKSVYLSLKWLEEIQQTGDIFFPKGWLNNTVGLYSSKEAYQIVQTFLKGHPNLNPQLKLKILQATDDLYRVNRLVKTHH